jgi:hypothetical protein
MDALSAGVKRSARERIKKAVVIHCRWRKKLAVIGYRLGRGW